MVIDFERTSEKTSSGILRVDFTDGRFSSLKFVIECRKDNNVYFCINDIPQSVLENVELRHALKAIESAKTNMANVACGVMSLKEFLKETPQFRLFFNDEGKLLSF